MKLLFLLLLLWFSCLDAMAQHDLYNWQLKGYTGMAGYYNPDKHTRDYFKLDHNLWHRFEMGRSLGNTFGFSASASFGKVKGIRPQGSTFFTEVRMASARLYFYTDNGWLLQSSAFVSPYFFGGYGLSTFTLNNTGAPNKRENIPAIPFGLGLKLRLTERWQLDLQTEAVYNTRPHLNPAEGEQNKHNNIFLHTGLALAYSFGFKQSAFKAPRFYVGFRDTLSPTRAIQPVIARNLAKLSARISQPNLIKYPARLGNVYSGVAAKETADEQTPITAFNIGVRQAAPRIQVDTAGIYAPFRTFYLPDYGPGATDVIYEKAPRVNENGRNQFSRESRQTVMLLESDRRKLEEANNLNRQLLHTRDSLFTLMAKDTLVLQQPGGQPASFIALENKTRSYMQQQAALNDSIRQRLTYYENELTRLHPPAALIQNAAPQQSGSFNTNGLPPASALIPDAAPQPTGSFDTNVYFQVNSYEVPSQSFNELLAIAAHLKANPDQKLQLTGYADQTGKADYNLVLSRKRVEGIAGFLQGQGIEKERILMQYFGEVESDDQLNPLNRKVVLQTIN